MPNQLRYDPSKTTMLRRKFMIDMTRRFKKISQAIQKLVVDDDVFGLVGPKPITFMQEHQAYRFMTNPAKLKAYRRWLQQQIDAELLTTDVVGKPWTATYVESAYKKGALHAYSDFHKEELAESEQFYRGTRAEFLRSAFGSPEALSKIELLSTRAFGELSGITATMSQQMNRILATGLAHGHGPARIARELRKSVATMTKTRAHMIARTEVINAHAEGQLDAFERLGVDVVGLMAEWGTAGDEKVCGACNDASVDGPYKLNEARGMIPLHPNCRCSWIPQLTRAKKRRKRKR